MAKVTNNRSRQCFVDESQLNDEFKKVCYPLLMELSHEFNNVICAVKEYYFKISTDEKLRMRMKVADEMTLSRLTVDIREMLKTRISEARNFKSSVTKQLADLVSLQAQKLDKKTAILFNKRKANPSAGQLNYAQDRVKSLVFEYNTRAEAERSRNLEKEINTLLHQICSSNPSTNEPEKPRSDRPSSASSNRSIESQTRTVVTWSSEPIVPTINTSGSNQQTSTGTIVNPPSEPRSEADIQSAIKNTQLEQVEKLDIQGLPANQYIYCIEPDPENPDVFDIGT